MSAILLDGNAIAARIREGLRARVEALRRAGRPPFLVAVQAGKDPASAIYLRNQRRLCEENGVGYRLDDLPADASLDAVLDHLDALGRDPSVTGVIVQRPLPPQVPARALQAAIPPVKDVEGTNPANLGMVIYGRPTLVTCTALSVMAMIREARVPLRGAEAVVVGHSEIAGKPTALLLLDELATVTVCHIGTRDLALHTRRADILVVAVGKPGLVRADMVKKGALIVDVGINRVGNRTVGDVDEGARDVAGFLTPVPGGVGPVTVTTLLRNTVECARVQAGLPAWQEG
ncbi:MAG: bifunctional 5,10-methylenetetrahydrofolate dehydrogenase/5,10-methenyltetrahydrofolate cyclohydrolase [Planctomycetales bacterium]|nr:bifunctional 5,10-methylenetetrahydrofolate dehydrogenase/5,10-methenyltetrahydrofolate cyclohydrolase [Planctomycetales bacterium]